MTIKLLTILTITLAISFNANALSSGDKRTKQVKYIVLHSIGGPTCTSDNKVKHTAAGKDAEYWAKFLSDHKEVSIHYVIDKQGTLVKGISEDQIAWHTGNRNYNATSIGIELVNQGNGIDTYTEAQINAVVKLLKDLKSRYSTAEIVTHDQIDKRTFDCVGGKLMKRKEQKGKFKLKVDPGKNFPLDDVLSRVSG